MNTKTSTSHTIDQIVMTNVVDSMVLTDTCDHTNDMVGSMYKFGVFDMGDDLNIPQWTTDTIAGINWDIYVKKIYESKI